MKTEIETLTPFVEARSRRRAVPVEAASEMGTVLIVPVAVVESMVVIEPEHAPVDSVHVPEQRCIATVSGEIEVNVCWIPKELSAVVLILLTLKYRCQQLPVIVVLFGIDAVVAREIPIFLAGVALMEVITAAAGIPAATGFIPMVKPVTDDM